MSTGTRTSIEVHVIHGEQIRTRSAIVALLLSATVHLGVLLGLGLRFPPSQNEASTNPLNATLVRPVSELPPLPDPGDSAQSFDSKQPGSRIPLPSGNHSREDRATRAGLQSQPGVAPAHYFLNNEVDIPAEPLTLPSIVLPEQAYISKLSGKVRARVYIDFQGEVDFIEILEPRPRYSPFEEIAIDALKNTRYLPAELYGQAVNSQKIVEVIFNPYEDSTSENEQAWRPAGN